MDMTLPPLGAAMLQAIGLPWINVDASRVDDTASAITASAPALESAAHAAETQTRHVTEHSSGDGVNAMADFLPLLGGAAGLGAAAALAHRFMPAALHGFANVVRGSQLASISQLVHGAVRFMAAGLAGGPLVAQGVLAATKLAYARIRQALARGVAKVLTPALRKNSTGVFADVADKLKNLKLNPMGGAFAGRRLAADGPGGPVGATRVDIKKWKGIPLDGDTSWVGVGGRKASKNAKPSVGELSPSDRKRIAEEAVGRGKHKKGSWQKGDMTEVYEYNNRRVTIHRSGKYEIEDI